MFSHVEPYAGDPILGLMDKHKQDPRADKVNLGVGVYFDNDGKLPVLNCVQKAEAQIANPAKTTSLSTNGRSARLSRALCQNLLFGKDAQVLKTSVWQLQRPSVVQARSKSGLILFMLGFHKPNAMCLTQRGRTILVSLKVWFLRWANIPTMMQQPMASNLMNSLPF